MTLTVGGQAMRADLAFQYGADASGNRVVAIVASNVSMSFGAAGTVTDGSGIILASASGIDAQLTGTLSLAVPGVSASGTFTIDVNSSGAAVPATSFTVGGQTVSITLPASTPAGTAYVKVTATGASLTVLGETVSGDLTATFSGSSLSIALSGGSVSLDGGIATATGVSGMLTVGSGALTAALSGYLTVTAPGISITPASTTTPNASFSVDTAAGTFSATLTGVSATVASTTVSGDFTITVTIVAGSPELELQASHLGFSIGSALTITDASGNLYATSQGVAGSLSIGTSSDASITLGTSAVSFTSLTIQASTFAQPTTPPGAMAPLPAGPYLSVTVTGLQFSLGSSVSIGNASDAFAFSLQPATDGSLQATVAVTGVNVTATNASITGGQGALLITSAGIAGLLTGTASGDTGAGGVTISGTVTLVFNSAVAPSPFVPIDETIPVGGSEIHLQFGSGQFASGAASPYISLSIADGTLTLGPFVTVEGSVTGSTDGNFAGEGLTVFVGQGPAFLAGGAINPLAVGILITNATVGLVTISGNHAFVATGTATVVGANGITLTGTVSVTYNDTGQIVNQTITIPGSTDPGVSVSFPTTAMVYTAELDNGQVTIGGQTLTGSFFFEPVAADGAVPAGLGVAATGVSLSLGGGLLSVTNGSGGFVITPAGIAGSVTATLSVGGISSDFGGGGTFTIDVNTIASAVSDTFTLDTKPASTPVTFNVPAGPYVRIDVTGVSLTVANQTLAADEFSAETVTLAGGSGLAVAVSNGHITLGTSAAGAALTNINGELLATSTGVAASLSAQISFGLPQATGATSTYTPTPPVSLTGTFSLDINTTTSAVSQTFTIGGATTTLSVPGGPYFEVAATDATLTVEGVTVTGSIALQVTTHTGGTVVTIAVSGGAITLGGAASLVSISAVTGILEIAPASAPAGATVAGSLSGEVSLALPSATISGTLGVQFNTSNAPVSDTLTVGGRPVVLSVPKGPYAAVTGTGVTLTIAGQSITTDVMIGPALDAQGNPVVGSPTLQITLANLSAQFGGTAGAPVLTAAQTGPVGSLTVSPAGIVGTLTVGLTLGAIPGLQFSTTAFVLGVNTTSAAVQQTVTVSGTPETLTLAAHGIAVQAIGAQLAFEGVSLTADIAISAGTDANGASVASLVLANGSASFGGGAVTLSNINGAVIVTRGGVAGSLSATVAAASSAFAISGTFMLSVNTTSAAVSDTLTVGSGQVTLALPAGPYLQLSATEATIVVDGQTLSGSLTISQSSLEAVASATATPGTSNEGVPAVSVIVSNGTLALGDGTTNFISVTQINGVLLVFDNAPAKDGSASTVHLTGLAGQLSGMVMLNGVPGVALSATMALSVNTMTSGLSAVITQGTSTSVVSWAAGPTLSLTASNVSATIAGQTRQGHDRGRPDDRVAPPHLLQRDDLAGRRGGHVQPELHADRVADNRPHRRLGIVQRPVGARHQRGDVLELAVGDVQHGDDQLHDDLVVHRADPRPGRPNPEPGDRRLLHDLGVQRPRQPVGRDRRDRSDRDPRQLRLDPGLCAHLRAGARSPRPGSPETSAAPPLRSSRICRQA